jgi:hypothetical protein
MKFILTNTGSFLGGLTLTYFDKLDKLGFTYLDYLQKYPDRYYVMKYALKINIILALLKLIIVMYLILHKKNLIY